MNRLWLRSFVAVCCLAAVGVITWGAGATAQKPREGKFAASDIQLGTGSTQSFPLQAVDNGIEASHQALYGDNGYLSTGIAWGDVNRDGWQDVYVTNNAGYNTLYVNNGDGSFAKSPLSDSISLPGAISGGASFVDYNNDGWLDLYVLNYGMNVLYMNDGGEQFVNVTETAGVGDVGKGESAGWGDFDGDGWLDLYVANWAMTCNNWGCDMGVPMERDTDKLYRNNGDGTFADVTDYLTEPQRLGAGFVGSWVDYDSDGDLDIYVVNDKWGLDTKNVLWRNDGAGCDGWCFTDVSAESNSDQLIFGMGLAIGDYDNDLDLDLYMSNMGTAGESMKLLRNEGDGTFADVSAESGAGIEGGVGWGTIMSDFNNDGWLDLYMSQAIMMVPETTPNRIFINNRDGSFTDFTDLAGGNGDGDSMSVGSVDVDNDGRMDVMVGNWDSGYQLFQNQSGLAADNNWAKIELIGSGDVNRQAVGARVYITRSDGLEQMQEVKLGSSMGVSNDIRLHFGLGMATIESATVVWPNGVSQTFDSVPVNQILTLEYAN